VKLPEYREVVGDQAVELERRMQLARVTIELVAGANGWTAEVMLASGASFAAQAPILATALYLAAHAAGLTEGLNPPPRGS
jgi:hypothetical protein